MKCVLAVLCLAAVAYAAPSGIYGAALAPAAVAYAPGLGSYGAYNLQQNAYGLSASLRGLVAYPNGAVVPVDEPAVIKARADHLAAKLAYGH